MTIAGFTFAAWTVLSTDATQKHAACRCICGRVQVVAVDALTSGSSTSCGCQRLTAGQSNALRAETEQRRQQRDRDWRPSRGR
jgi:hypothetical protein